MKYLLAVLALTYGAFANAATHVLDPGPGTQYLAAWCGGQQVNEWAIGFDDMGNPRALVRVTTTCHGSGRGAPNIYHQSCTAVTFAFDGTILSKVLTGASSGHSIVSCASGVDPAAVFLDRDTDGNVFGTLSTTLSSGLYRAVLDYPDVPPTPDTVAPTVPQNLVALTMSDSRIDLAWSPSVDWAPGHVAGYSIVRDGIVIATTTQTTFSDTGLEGNTLYTYTVRAFDSASPANLSADSATVSVSTLNPDVMPISSPRDPHEPHDD